MQLGIQSGYIAELIRSCTYWSILSRRTYLRTIDLFERFSGGLYDESRVVRIETGGFLCTVVVHKADNHMFQHSRVPVPEGPRQLQVTTDDHNQPNHDIYIAFRAMYIMIRDREKGSALCDCSELLLHIWIDTGVRGQSRVAKYCPVLNGHGCGNLYHYPVYTPSMPVSILLKNFVGTTYISDTIVRQLRIFLYSPQRWRPGREVFCYLQTITMEDLQSTGPQSQYKGIQLWTDHDVHLNPFFYLELVSLRLDCLYDALNSSTFRATTRTTLTSTVSWCTSEEWSLFNPPTRTTGTNQRSAITGISARPGTA